MTGAASTPDPWAAKHVAALRKARNETQVELAEALGVNEHSVWMWEKGRRPPTRPVNVLATGSLARETDSVIASW